MIYRPLIHSTSKSSTRFCMNVESTCTTFIEAARIFHFKIKIVHLLRNFTLFCNKYSLGALEHKESSIFDIRYLRLCTLF